jgi:hypothetical protein
VAYTRDASAQRLGDLARTHLFAFGKGLNDGEGDRVPQKPAEPRLSVVIFFHEACISRLLNCANPQISSEHEHESDHDFG